MKWNKLLERQMQKHLREGTLPAELIPFLEAINNSYNAYERDRELSERAFKISEEEYIEVTRQLKEELAQKKLSIEQLKEAAVSLGEGGIVLESENLADIAGFLSEQVNKRKVAANRLSALIRNMQTGILLEDEHGLVALTNQTFCDIFGIPRSPEALVGQDFSRMTARHNSLFLEPERFTRRIARLLEDKKVAVDEEIHLADGRIVERDYIPIFIDGIYSGQLWNYKDITKRKRDEARLKASEELWHFALEGAGEGVWQYYLPEKDVFISPRHHAMLGFDDEDTVISPGKWLSLVHPEDKHILFEVDEAYSRDAISWHEREYRVLHRDGHFIWILERGMVIRRHPDGMPARIVGTHSDITERKLAEQNIRLREEKYRNIIDNMNLGLVEADNEGLIQYVNQRFCDMSGYTPEELTGQNFLPGLSDASEVAVQNKKGDTRWWFVSRAANYNDSGVARGSVLIALDITDRKKLEVELQEARESAEQSAKAKESFLANMSHEIRTPMNAIKGMSIQLKKTPLDAKQQQYLDTIHTATNHLMVVINDILDMSKIQAGMLSIESIGMNLDNVIRHAIHVMEPDATEKGLALGIHLPAGLYPILMGDPHRLNQVLLNLLSNSIKFSEKGGVDVTCSVLNATPSSQLVRIVVKDTGIGMDANFLSTIFEQFSQEDRSIARKYGGTGLGMAITRQLIKLMNGDIEVFSEKGKGTEVCLTLPFQRGKKADLPSDADNLPGKALLKGKHILIVEDNELNRFVVKTLLKGYGVVIAEAVNGAEAVRLLREQTFDLVLMDVQMPVMSGLEAIAIIRNDLKLGVPVIALTANAIREEIDRYRLAGMNDHVSKPFEEATLIRAMTQYLG
ncbi:PAS domain-containing hybrid sensor histidine kinase/response regulator [Dinghuibacter silviterrae]|uniref:Sensory/regulatory protein RpfC n=1 Tax=Dinghuibacter silviterrae TaxID=1539049 RepID=A0A4R8DJ49_9BACT|nr:PAS domain-containing hybrid sensor histidine kinase/response regulator [Dinghuibacter silviterrae]TDW97354.1 PAS domain S-box-containing protein [Dinghuibacter silviterrae]